MRMLLHALTLTISREAGLGHLEAELSAGLQAAHARQLRQLCMQDFLLVLQILWAA